MEKRRVVLYGNSLILGTLRTSLQQYSHLEIIPLSPPLPTVAELGALKPDAIIFDAEFAQPEFATPLLEGRPNLLLIGINSGGDQTLFWSGQQSRTVTMQDLVQVINALPDTMSQPLTRWSTIARVRRFIFEQRNFAGDLERLRHFTRQQKLAIAVAIIALCSSLILVLAQSFASPNATGPLIGTAQGSDVSPEIGLAFIVGIMLGGVIIGLLFGLRVRKHKGGN